MTTSALQERPASAATGRAAARPGSTAVLAIILVGYFMVILDNSIIITGLPHIATELGLSAA